MMLSVNSCSRFDIAEDALKLVTHNYSSLANIKGEDKRRRVGSVVARAHETISWYRHQTVVYRRYAEETQQDHPDIGAVATLAEQ